MAQDLFDIGVARKDALTVLTAARLALAVNPRPGRALHLPKNPRPAADTAADSPPSAPDAAAMLAVAKDLAGADDTLLYLIEIAEGAPAAAPLGSALRYPARLGTGARHVWKVPFFGDSPAELAIIGNGAANLDLVVTDESGAVICREAGGADRALCRFVPARNGYFSATVVNTGTAPNDYDLVTN